MTPGIPQSQSELDEHLREQLQFLETSADAFDRGIDSEAKRLAGTLRLLLHDTSKSKSLLGQLGMKGVDFCDTAFLFDPDNLLSYMGLLKLQFSSAGLQYKPNLDDEPNSCPRKVNFGDWWEKTVVFADHDRKLIYRKDLVLNIADQDGGVHVDPTLNETYAKLSRLNSLGLVYTQGNVSRLPKSPERAAVRQIAHEVLKTLKPGYYKIAP